MGIPQLLLLGGRSNLSTPCSYSLDASLVMSFLETRLLLLGSEVVVITDYSCHLPGSVFILPQVNKPAFTGWAV
jgi:hypothetical protein